MSGFENFQISEISSIGAFRSYSDKIGQLNSSIIETFKGAEKDLQKFGLKLNQGWGEKNLANHYGAIFFPETDTKASDSGFWILLGISTKSPELDWEFFYPKLLCENDHIPDIELLVCMEFETNQNLQKFLSSIAGFDFESWNSKNEYGFELDTFGSDVLNIVMRRPLSSFLPESDQELEIINYLHRGLKAILEPDSPLDKIIQSYLELQNG